MGKCQKYLLIFLKLSQLVNISHYKEQLWPRNWGSQVIWKDLYVYEVHKVICSILCTLYNVPIYENILIVALTHKHIVTHETLSAYKHA